MAHNVRVLCVRWGVTPLKIINSTKFKNMHTDSKKHDTPTDTNNVLVAGHLVSGGNFKLKKKIETLDEFWKVINTEKSFFARHRMYPTAFFFSWQIKSINQWLEGGWFWVTEPSH